MHYWAVLMNYWLFICYKNIKIPFTGSFSLFLMNACSLWLHCSPFLTKSMYWEGIFDALLLPNVKVELRRSKALALGVGFHRAQPKMLNLQKCWHPEQFDPQKVWPYLINHHPFFICDIISGRTECHIHAKHCNTSPASSSPAPASLLIV